MGPWKEAFEIEDPAFEQRPEIERDKERLHLKRFYRVLGIVLAMVVLVLTGCEDIWSLTPSPQPVCTPPPCDFENGEVYHCPGDCPGGCGTQCATVTPGLPTLVPDADYQTAEVIKIVDGDTIDVEIEGETYRLRYIGMDTPERDRPFYAEATEANRQLVEKQTVYLEKDVSETDRYGRLLRYVYLQDGRMVNAELMRQGFAQAATFPPDVKYQETFTRLQREAREAGRGLWGE